MPLHCRLLDSDVGIAVIAGSGYLETSRVPTLYSPSRRFYARPVSLAGANRSSVSEATEAVAAEPAESMPAEGAVPTERTPATERTTTKRPMAAERTMPAERTAATERTTTKGPLATERTAPVKRATTAADRPAGSGHLTERALRHRRPQRWDVRDDHRRCYHRGHDHRRRRSRGGRSRQGTRHGNRCGRRNPWFRH